MGKQSRRAGRRRSSSQFQAAPSGIDLTKLSVTDISSVKMDSAENQVMVELQLPVDGGVSYAHYAEVLDFDEQDIPGYLRDAARRMYEACMRAVQERVYTSREVPCATCTGKCCGRAFSAVRLTYEDVERLREVVDVEEQVTFYRETAFTGHVGEFDLVQYRDTDEMCCPNLTQDGCSIYEHRPLVCREFSAWDCDIYEEDPEKVEKRRLQVVD